MDKSKWIATTVKINSDLYDDFKICGIKHKFSLQGFVEKCVHLYLHNQPFQEIVDDFNVPSILTILSGSFRK